MKLTNTSGICKIIHHNGSYSLLLGKRKILGFEISCE